jgi:hypothetical protein
MKLTIRTIVDHGHDSERIVLDVTQAANLKYYLVFDTTYLRPGAISNKLRHTYWFAPQAVQVGDVVVLYTKKGSNTSRQENGHTVYFYYWGLDSCVWNDEGDRALLMEANAWITKGFGS